MQKMHLVRWGYLLCVLLCFTVTTLRNGQLWWGFNLKNSQVKKFKGVSNWSTKCPACLSYHWYLWARQWHQPPLSTQNAHTRFPQDIEFMSATASPHLLPQPHKPCSVFIEYPLPRQVISYPICDQAGAPKCITCAVAWGWWEGCGSRSWANARQGIRASFKLPLSFLQLSLHSSTNPITRGFLGYHAEFVGSAERRNEAKIVAG